MPCTLLCPFLISHSFPLPYDDHSSVSENLIKLDLASADLISYVHLQVIFQHIFVAAQVTVKQRNNLIFFDANFLRWRRNNCIVPKFEICCSMGKFFVAFQCIVAGKFGKTCVTGILECGRCRRKCFKRQLCIMGRCHVLFESYNDKYFAVSVVQIIVRCAIDERWHNRRSLTDFQRKQFTAIFTEIICTFVPMLTEFVLNCFRYIWKCL